MEQKPSLNSSWPREEQDLNLREWGLKAAGRISRENTKSRRFSASHIKSFREETRSFRSNVTISSTASSPGYSLKDEIDPSTYSFTTALRALQVKSGYVWDCLSPDGFALNSKWNEAEKYICNPVSGEIPMECLSSKTLSGRSINNINIPTTKIKSRITVSGPLVYNSSSSSSSQYPCLVQSKPILTQEHHHEQQEEVIKSPIKEENNYLMSSTTITRRDVGTQSTPTDHHLISSSSSIPISPATSTPPIKERSMKINKRCEALQIDQDSPISGSNIINSKSTDDQEEVVVVQMIEEKQNRVQDHKDADHHEEEEGEEEGDEMMRRNIKNYKNKKEDKYYSNKRKQQQKWKLCRRDQLQQQAAGELRCFCFLSSWRRFWMKLIKKRQRS